jgi:hypothetical protein
MINDHLPHEQLLTRQRFPCAYGGLVNVEKTKVLRATCIERTG